MSVTPAGLPHARLVDLPKLGDERGHLTFVEGARHAPFDIRRVYYLYDVPGGSARGGHAHRELQQLIIAVSGSFDVVLSDAGGERRFSLSRPDQGLYVPRMVWRDLENFSAGAVCLVLASEPYDEADYYRDHDDFRRAVESR